MARSSSSSTRAPSDVTYPTSLGYFRQDGFDPDPYPVDMGAHQLDEDLIREINSAEGYQLRGELIDFQKENGHAQPFSNTDILEKFIHMKKGPSNGKLRIFARGGALCDFLTVTNGSGMQFKYDREENVVRLNKALAYNHNRAFDFTKIGEKRLTGCKDAIIVFGKVNIYRVFEIIHPDYELYYTKEVEGFHGGDPIEIRGVLAAKNCMNSSKMLFKDVAMGGITKVVVIIVKEDLHTVDRVSIIDTFEPFDHVGARSRLFTELEIFFCHHIGILTRLEQGYISKAYGGTIICPKRKDANPNGLICSQKLSSDFYKYFYLDNSKAGDLVELIHTLEIRSIQSPSMFSLRETDLFLCFNNLHSVNLICQGVYDLSSIRGILVEDWNTPLRNCKEFGERRRTNKHYAAISHRWRDLIRESHPELLRPIPLCTCDAYVFVPPFRNLPEIQGCVRNDDLYSLSKKTTFATVEQISDLNRMIQQMLQFGGPFPEFVPDMRLKIYTWAEPNDCEAILRKFFGEKIVFEEPEEDAPVICCHIEKLPPGCLFEDVFIKTMGLPIPIPRDSKKYQMADLYLVEDGAKIPFCWKNSYDLQLVKHFQGFDSLRKFPGKIALFGRCFQTAADTEEKLRGTHVFLKGSSNPWIFVQCDS